MNFNNKDNLYALIGTILFHLICIYGLYLGVMRSVIPGEERVIYAMGLEGIPVQRIASQPQEPATQQPTQQPTTRQPERTQPPQRTPVNRPIAQNREESVPVDTVKRDLTAAANEAARREREAEERKRREENERRQREEELRRQQENAINNRVSNAFGSGSSQGASSGVASTGTASQGSPTGNSDSGATSGSGGFGTFNLNGRSVGSGGLPRPIYTGQEVGKIILNITVDPNGNVIAAEIGRGTNIDNASMRNSALEAARRAKFNKIQGANNQNGTITYNYELEK